MLITTPVREDDNGNRVSRCQIKTGCRMSCVGGIHEMEARTVPLMQMRQIGQRCSCCVHSAQQTKWPQGRNTMLTSASIHTLHVLSSFSFSFSSNMCVVGTEPKHAVNFYDTQLLSTSISTHPATVIEQTYHHYHTGIPGEPGISNPWEKQFMSVTVSTN